MVTDVGGDSCWIGLSLFCGQILRTKLRSWKLVQEDIFKLLLAAGVGAEDPHWQVANWLGI